MQYPIGRQIIRGLLMVLIFCQTSHATAKIKFLNSEYDFGTISQGKVVETKFNFVNQGSSDLLILGTHASCGCTSVLESPEKTYKKGQRGTLRVQFDSKGFHGQITKTITLMTNEKIKPMRLLTIHGKVKRGITTTPEVLDFAKVYTSKPKTLSLDVKSQQGGLNDLNLVFDQEIIEVKKQVFSEKHWKLLVTPSTKLTPGLHKTRLQLSDPLKEGTTEVPVFVDLKSSFHATQDQLAFGKIKPGASKSVSLRLKGVKDSDLRTPSIKLYLNGNEINQNSSMVKIVKKSVGSDVEYKFSIKNTNHKRGALHGEVEFKNKQENGRLLLPVQGYLF